jgi:hypothetical protein
MRDSKVGEEVIKESIESMHRFDAPNMVKIQTSEKNYPGQNSVIFQAPNDKLAIDFGAELPKKYLKQSQTKDSNVLVVATPVTNEVWNPAKRIKDKKTGLTREPLKEELDREEELTKSLPKIKTFDYITKFSISFNENIKITNEEKVQIEKIKLNTNNDLEDETLDDSLDKSLVASLEESLQNSSEDSITSFSSNKSEKLMIKNNKKLPDKISIKLKRSYDL